MKQRALTGFRAACLLLAVCLGLPAQSSGQKFKDLALTPPMGWNSWNRFACDINESLMRQTADAMVSSGMADAGYRYLVIDDCWHGQRDSLGFIHPDPDRFPSGMKALADYIHGRGLKFGIYSCAGIQTCGGRPGSRGHEYQDALTYARWGVDYLKYDWCNTGKMDAAEAYTTMRDALYAAGRPVVFSLCEWGNNKPWLWGAEVGHLWRTTGDIHDCWDCDINYGTWTSWGMLSIVDMQKDLRQYAGPGHWNDPDMMEVGNGGMTATEDKAHFTLWCMLAAPLMAGNDLRNMSPETVRILTRREVIAVDQDSLGVQGFRFMKSGDLEVWVKPLMGGDLAFCFFNRGGTPRKVEYDWKADAVNDGVSHTFVDFKKTEMKLRDLWAGRDAGTTAVPFRTILAPHDVVLLRLTKQATSP
jgi:alpha-galactosidase